jgi:hypothetical protein
LTDESKEIINNKCSEQINDLLSCDINLLYSFYAQTTTNYLNNIEVDGIKFKKQPEEQFLSSFLNYMVLKMNQ